MNRKKIIVLYHSIFNIKFAIISALFNGCLVIVINYSHGLKESIYAGSIQAILSFFATGITARVVQYFSPIPNPWTSYFWGSLIPAILTFIMAYGTHWWGDTPEILASSISSTVVSYTTSYVTNFITRRGYLRPLNYPAT